MGAQTIFDISKRPRRNRKSPGIRSLVEETVLTPSDLVVPFFIKEGTKIQDPIEHLPGVFHYSTDSLIKEAESLHTQGIAAIALFPVIDPSLRDDEGRESYNPNSLIVRAIKSIKQEIPTLTIIADVALDPFTSHGHDGILKDGEIHNDLTIEALVRQSMTYADAGSDIIAPSDMMDGRVGILRKALDPSVGILSYTAKYASALYGPFRKAMGTTLMFGDKKTYQMNPANRREALREAHLDEEEGADMLLVKPALPYLDILSDIKEKSFLPVGAYHVSGEYAMLMGAAEKGYLNVEQALYESLISIKRAGADFIFTYGAPTILPLLNS